MASPLPIVYLVLVVALCLHGLHRAILVWTAWRFRALLAPLGDLPAELPLVTVQLPFYNERDVAARLVEAVVALNWPPERIQIQILDDSTDDTLGGCEAALRLARQKGIAVELLRRSHRVGYKAGALQAGLATARGELIAIFDADFVPEPEFLRRMVPSFADPRVGMVQARWGHLNEGASALTQAQALMLDGHFVVEHTARFRAGLWFHFNGTAGLWRRGCVDEAGGWSADTLTEDLDISYRAQLAGWKFVYRVEELVPAELPDSLSAFYAQQARWARGSMQTLRKLFWPLLTSSAPLKNRMEALLHLSANLAWPLGLGVALLLPAVVGLPVEHSLLRALVDGPAFLLSTGANVLFYTVARAGKLDLPAILRVLLLGVGLSVNQSRAVLGGLLGRRGAFVRTPKAGDRARSYGPEIARLPLVELALGLWNLWGLGVAVIAGRWGAVPFLLLFSAGFGWVVWLGALEARASVGRLLRPAPALGR
jgi:cellulose synthase/poly-beta-1,6-N-acetylglucosamine synthase-like glycosyltransferase